MTHLNDYRSLTKVFLGLVSVFLMSACASEAEKRERRENAFDISGDYKISQSSGSEMDMNLSIRNESGRHDIVVNLERLSAMSQKEISLLNAQGINPATVASHFTNRFALGKGKDTGNLSGGENISSDFGESSQYSVCSDVYQYNAEYKIYYCLSGTIQKSGKKMKGRLTLTWSRERKVKVNGQDQDEYTSKQTDLSYQTDVSHVFYKQYLGQWSGDVYSLIADFNGSVFKNIAIKENADQTYSTYLPSVQSLQFRGENYVYDSSSNGHNRISLEYLKRPDYPAVQMAFVGPAGKRLVLFGQLWSLGNFTGSITLVLPDHQVDLATFRMKKD